MAHDLDIERSFSQARQPATAGSLFDTFADQVLRRVDDVIAGRECPWPPTLAERQFLEVIRNHQGNARAVPLGLFAERLKLNARQVKELVQNLRENFRLAIGSSRACDNGYFLFDSEAECFEFTSAMYHQAVTMLRVVSRMRGTAQNLQQMLSQIALDLEYGKGDVRG